MPKLLLYYLQNSRLLGPPSENDDPETKATRALYEKIKGLTFEEQLESEDVDDYHKEYIRSLLERFPELKDDSNN